MTGHFRNDILQF